MQLAAMLGFALSPAEFAADLAGQAFERIGHRLEAHVGLAHTGKAPALGRAPCRPGPARAAIGNAYQIRHIGFLTDHDCERIVEFAPGCAAIHGTTNHLRIEQRHTTRPRQLDPEDLGAQSRIHTRAALHHHDQRQEAREADLADHQARELVSTFQMLGAPARQIRGLADVEDPIRARIDQGINAMLHASECSRQNAGDK